MIRNFKKIKFYLLLFCSLFITSINAHETWILTPTEIDEWNAKPLPDIFTGINETNLIIIFIALLFLSGWTLLHYTGARELFPGLQRRLASYANYGCFSVRLGLGTMLALAAIGLNPHHETSYFEAATFIAPDLELRRLSDSWQWVALAEGVIAGALLLGIYVRVAAASLLCLSVLGLFLYSHEMLAYFGIVAGSCIFLLMQGAGSLYIPLPCFSRAYKLVNWLANQPRERALWIMRVLSGLNFLYLGIWYKLLQPNLMLALTEVDGFVTFGFETETFVFIVAIIEIAVGVLMLMGFLMRPLTFILLAAFLFFSYIFGEGLQGHAFIYGILGAYLTVGRGRWRRPVATDKKGKIIILGGGFAAIHCAIKLERLRGQFSNVEVVLVHQDANFQFDPLLTNVLSGTVQPANIINSIRYICPTTKLIRGQVTTISPNEKKIKVLLKEKQTLEVDYDRLIIALDKQTNTNILPTLYSFPFVNVGDAIVLRRQIISCLEKAEVETNEILRRRYLTFTILGADISGCSTAAAVKELVWSALPTYSGIQSEEIRIIVIDRRKEVLRGFPSKQSRLALQRLNKLGIIVHTQTDFLSVNKIGVTLPSKKFILSGTVINTLSDRPSIIDSLPVEKQRGRLAVNHLLQLSKHPDVLVAGDSANFPLEVPYQSHREISMGRRAGYNAYASIQGHKLQKWTNKKPWLTVVSLGRYSSIISLWGVCFSGYLAWTVSKFLYLFTLPGLEKNLRLIIDWVLDVVFSNNIAAWSPSYRELSKKTKPNNQSNTKDNSTGKVSSEFPARDMKQSQEKIAD